MSRRNSHCWSFSSFLVGLGLVVGSSLAQADAINIRPIGPLGDNSFEDTLQEVLDDITVSGPGIDAVNDQFGAALYTSTASGGAVATFIIELAGNASSNIFGIYSADNPTNQAAIFDGAGTDGDQALISFLANGDIRVNSVTAATGFSSSFGFFLDTPGDTFFSEDDLNPDGNAQALIYQGDNATTLQISPFNPGLFLDHEYIIAFEDIEFNSSDKDFNDLVVLVESIAPVPEPGTFLLLGTGLAGLGLWGRRRFRGEKN